MSTLYLAVELGLHRHDRIDRAELHKIAAFLSGNRLGLPIIRTGRHLHPMW